MTMAAKQEHAPSTTTPLSGPLIVPVDPNSASGNYAIGKVKIVPLNR